MTSHSTALIRFMEVGIFSTGVMPAFESIVDNDNISMVFYSLLKFLYIFILFKSVLWMRKLRCKVAYLRPLSWQSLHLNLEHYLLDHTVAVHVRCVGFILKTNLIKVCCTAL